MAYKGSLVELPLLGTYWVYEPHVYNLGNHLVIQSRMSRTSTFWLAWTKYRLVPYSPALVWFKNTRFNIRNATHFTTFGTFQRHFSFLRRDYPGKPFCTGLLSFAPAYLGYDRYIHNHLCFYLQWSSPLTEASRIKQRILCCKKFLIIFGSSDLFIKQLLALAAECLASGHDRNTASFPY